ncbi:hypothetical protein [Gloeothece verrucosa]|uniref:Sulfotransferase domain-containing protein n=1 Tax=Gloeothece verrucosa (strain PCC 7822) TaxID=497965 RepID=E0U7F2_GLOV7|nr:hypothetical protein [Gloeothece verrucosa]ADN13648.1 hypothetical protein Cyan7822_1658 [Gloeothece verrucosa PCC 7822]
METRETKILIHIGYHKTGSSFLQKLIFNSAEYGFYSPWSPEDYIEELIIVNPFSFESSQARAFFAPGICESWQKGLIPVITHEMLSGNPWKKGYSGSGKETADRLIATFPEGRVLIVIREQSKMLLSLYKHQVRNNLTASIQDYLEAPRPRSGFEPLFTLGYLEYHWLILYYQKLFGKENVLVLPHEMLKNKEEVFFKKLSCFTGTNIDPTLQKQVINEGYSGLILALKRWTNFVSHRDSIYPNSRMQELNNRIFYYLNKIVPKSLNDQFENELKKYINHRIDKYYQQSNQITSQIIGIDLESYGYQI